MQATAAPALQQQLQVVETSSACNNYNYIITIIVLFPEDCTKKATLYKYPSAPESSENRLLGRMETNQALHSSMPAVSELVFLAMTSAVYGHVY